MPKRPTKKKSAGAKVGDSAKRSVRTGVQGTISAAVLVQGYNLFVTPPLTADQTQWATVAGSALVSFIMNLLEEVGMPALFKKETPTQLSDDEMDERKFDALAAAIGNQRLALERLEAAVQLRQPEPEHLRPTIYEGL